MAKAKKKFSTSDPKHIMLIVGVAVVLVILVLAMQQMYHNAGFYGVPTSTNSSGY